MFQVKQAEKVVAQKRMDLACFSNQGKFAASAMCGLKLYGKGPIIGIAPAQAYFNILLYCWRPGLTKFVSGPASLETGA